VNDDFFVNVFEILAGKLWQTGTTLTNEEMQQVFNSLGQMMIEKEETISSDFKITMDAEALSPGIYFLQLNSSSHHVVRKIVIAQ
jgi:hypothetical protein